MPNIPQWGVSHKDKAKEPHNTKNPTMFRIFKVFLKLETQTCRQMMTMANPQKSRSKAEAST